VRVKADEPQPGPGEPAEAGGRSLGEKIEWLIQNMWPPGAPPPKTNADAAAAITRATGEEMSSTSIWKLRTGRGDNPTLKTLTALASFFKVPIGYFGEGEEAESVGDEVALLVLMRDAGVSRAALRSFVDLSGESRLMITEMIESAARMERRRSSPAAPLDHGDDFV
jgi:transcriptional regulator with XRE-family HTH domain